MSESAHFARAGERHEVAPLRYWWSAGRHAPARGFTNCARLGDTYESTASTKLLRPASADKPGRRVAFARSEQNVRRDFVDGVAASIHHGVVELLADHTDRLGGTG